MAMIAESPAQKAVIVPEEALARTRQHGRIIKIHCHEPPD